MRQIHLPLPRDGRVMKGQRKPHREEGKERSRIRKALQFYGKVRDIRRNKTERKDLLVCSPAPIPPS